MIEKIIYATEENKSALEAVISFLFNMWDTANIRSITVCYPDGVDRIRSVRVQFEGDAHVQPMEMEVTFTKGLWDQLKEQAGVKHLLA